MLFKALLDEVEAMKLRGMSQIDVVRATGLSKPRVSQYVNGTYEAKQQALYKLSRALRVNVAWLMGNDVPMETGVIDNLPLVKNIFPIETKKIPLLRNIACGEPIYAEEEHELYIEAGVNIHADFCLRAQGDSMIGARIYDGDIVFIKKQEMVDNREIAAIIIGDEATLKRVFYDREANEISLYPENPQYKTLRFSGHELDDIEIIGKAVAFQSVVR